jgi:hypothetical protein
MHHRHRLAFRDRQPLRVKATIAAVGINGDSNDFTSSQNND